jgi:hypothetical protein
MSTLTYAHSDLAVATPAEAKPARKQFWTRLYDAIVESQQRRVEREIARYLADQARPFTDETEREIMRRLVR